MYVQTDLCIPSRQIDASVAYVTIPNVLVPPLPSTQDLELQQKSKNVEQKSKNVEPHTHKNQPWSPPPRQPSELFREATTSTMLHTEHRGYFYGGIGIIIIHGRSPEIVRAGVACHRRNNHGGRERSGYLRRKLQPSPAMTSIFNKCRDRTSVIDGFQGRWVLEVM